MQNVHDFKPFRDDHARDVLDAAAEALGILRGYRGPFLGDPAVCLHLIASLQHQLRADLLSAVLDAYEHGYAANELAVLLDHPA